VPTPADLRRDFIKAFERLTHGRERHDVWSDFLEMAFCTTRQQTLPPGPEADAIEARYMAVVKRNRLEDVRAMPRLFGMAALALKDGGCDFLGQVAVELELRSDHMGQFFTPYDVSRMTAEMTFDTADEVIAEQGFVTMQEPACGAGSMIVAAADALERKGFDIGQHLYVVGIDVSPMCFRMAYLQASLRGIPATIVRGNTLSGEIFEQAVTPAFFPFYAANRESFDAWRRGEGRGGVASPDAEITQQGAEAEPDEPAQPATAPAARSSPKRPPPTPTTYQGQLSLFDGEP
jgi:hypothetical protein